ncbi:LOW QUALITY PROTEIN: hypothetical protein Cgig2_003268 [Carnegiea gigantea]|uniref:Uncharacterized protein n=1 Tax=Carnegiea gigantea TaxID=171969 RepID=A0A9Q1GP35_9CARY|nr:LOW QUALITY PROTEIN: hypothetical protein Cgig2_003268 [Carnegiea gigantea]
MKSALRKLFLPSPGVMRRLCGHHHLGLPEETDIPMMRHCPLGAPHFRLWRAGDESHWHDLPPFTLGNKLKARNLETDFLVVDVPTAYNIILGPQGRVSASASRGLVTSSSEPSPSPEGRMNSTSSGSRPSASSCWHSATKTLHGRPHDLANSPAPWPLAALLVPAKAPPPASAANPSSRPPWHLFLLSASPSVYRATSPSSFRCSTAVLTTRAKASAIVTSSSVTLRGSKVLEAPKVGPDKVRGQLSSTYGSTAGDLPGSPRDIRGASKFPGTRGSVTNRLVLRALRRSGLIVPFPPTWVRAKAAVSSWQPSTY